MHRHQLTDEQWTIVEPLIPKKYARIVPGTFAPGCGDTESSR